MPSRQWISRDERGYFIVNKTSEQFEQDKEISRLLQSGEASLKSLAESEPVLIEVPTELADYLMYTLSSSISLKGHYDTMVKAYNGIIIYTRERSRILSYLQTLLSTN